MRPAQPLERIPDGEAKPGDALAVITRNNRIMLSDRERLAEWQRWWSDISEAIEKGP